MTDFPGSPRLLKGAIVGIDPANPLASVIVFQYNPDTLSGGLEPVGAPRGAGTRLITVEVFAWKVRQRKPSP